MVIGETWVVRDRTSKPSRPQVDAVFGRLARLDHLAGTPSLGLHLHSDFLQRAAYSDSQPAPALG